jgi:Right handed beta helix region
LRAGTNQNRLTLCCRTPPIGFIMMHNQLVALAAATLSLVAGLVNEPVDISAAQVERGGVTPDDAPGYPVTLSRPGHYRLSADLIVPAHADGIVITAPNVTLDLNGHRVRGPVRCTHSAARRAVSCDWQVEPSTRAGINTSAARHSVIRNGVVAGFAGVGIHHGEAALIENLEVSSNAGAGVVGAERSGSSVVRQVLVQHNGGSGIVCDGLTIERSSFADNGGTGVDCRGGVFSDSVSRGNGGFGVTDGFKPGLRTLNNRLGAVASVATQREAALAAREP